MGIHLLGCSQAVRHEALVLACGGSNPPTPTNTVLPLRLVVWHRILVPARETVFEVGSNPTGAPKNRISQCSVIISNLMTPFLILDLSHARHIYAVGDIHGCYSMLERKLELMRFDPEQDHLISVGDLVDRGPENERCVEFCAKPWFHWIRGNHEELMAITAERGALQRKNGQSWILDLSQEERDRISGIINDAPVILEVLTPSGKRCGFVHADYPTEDWAEAEYVAENMAHHCLWDRTGLAYPKTQGIKNIDHVFHGHTPLPDPRTIANISWIDTGACFENGKITLAKLP